MSDPAPDPAPRVSVVVRSYNRLPALCELLDVLLAQAHDGFEVIVVEQSTDVPAEAGARLAALEADRRLRVIRSGPLGGPRARNTGMQAARGEVVVFVDDDDVPVGRDFLTKVEARFAADPRCLGLTCRHYWGDEETISGTYRWLARSRCMRFSRLLRLPTTYPRYDHAVDRVDYVHGTGGAYRRTVFERFGGWDEDTPIEDETSLGIRVSRGLAAGEYLCFDPTPRLRRRMDLGGGLAKRKAGAAGFYRRFMTFVHNILGRYHPTRVRALYPLYVLAGWWWTCAWIFVDSHAHDTWWRRLAGAAAFTVTLPYHATRHLLKAPFGRRPGSGEALATAGNGAPATPTAPRGASA
ncbi:MAG: glycosyltransferase [Kofleriaceae bacterium]|nr:glycosyltransferase [Kofleriaceae bacterium]MCL4224313.1 glycosyltransferase [Myxococcales bacterium]